ncbi:MAG: crossover junction endodeoxyribonuclease RuvC [Muribaculum sp.]|nr:crossover junction endodeoxyribonuclease RuvC [Muribaculaceae bacterium]MCM1081766.1 crossover junction endodeoxyribonuclease RuvC [Muribaculum sp.]
MSDKLVTSTLVRNESLAYWDRIIIGIDPGTNVMGYGILGVKATTPSVIAMGVIQLSKFDSHYLRLGHIFKRVQGILEQYIPDEMALEAPFFGKNVQSMLKLGRAQGVAMAAAISRDISVTEYEPRKIKMSITGNGAAAKEQVQEMLRRILNIPKENLLPQLDATDALAAALCHFYESSKPTIARGPRSWKEFIAKNPDRIK